MTEPPILFGALGSVERIHVGGALLVLRAWVSHALSQVHPMPELDLPRLLRIVALYRGGQETTDQNDQ